ncbi:MAG: xanthine dehydrogenase family protein molybdopterin-binding subunit [Candidatus Ranarchaeia archaeon]
MTGTTRYCADLKFQGMLYGVVHQSSHPHAKILQIDTSEAEKSDGVIRVFTAKDIPGQHCSLSAIGNIPVLAKDKVRYAGEVIALVVANTQKHARAAAKKVKVTYEPLPVVTDPKKAMEPGAPDLSKGIELFGIESKNNICSELHTTNGDVEKGFQEADVVIEREYRTQFIEHEYMETECAIAVYNGHEMIIYGPAQYTFASQAQPMETLGLDYAHVIIRQTPIGGSYGGKAESMNVVISLAALAAYHLNKPVMVQLSREESMHLSSKRHPFILHYKAGVKKDGTLTALKIRNIADTGAYVTTAPFVLFRAHAQAPGPYKWQSTQVDSYMVFTNNALGASMRGFGNPQVIFATESMMDELAEAAGVTP